MNNLLKFHLYNHTTKGLGETPDTCAACQAELQKFKEEKKNSLMEKIAPAVAASIVSAFLVERLVRKK